MKSFRFHLERVLKVRQLQTLTAKQDLATAQVASAKAWVNLEQARTAREALDARITSRRSERIKAGERAALADQHERLCLVHNARAEEMDQRLAGIAEKRAALVASERKVKTLQRLKEQQYTEFLQTERAMEQAATDEMAQAVVRFRKEMI